MKISHKAFIKNFLHILFGVLESLVCYFKLLILLHFFHNRDIAVKTHSRSHITKKDIRNTKLPFEVHTEKPTLRSPVSYSI